MVHSGESSDPVSELITPAERLAVAPLLDAMRDQATEADRSRTINPELMAAIKASDFTKLAASTEIGGAEGSILQIGRELEAVASSCTSTAWVMWNHLAVFHLFAGCLGPDYTDFLSGIVSSGETVCFPAGASSGVQGVIEQGAEGDHVRLNGKGAFGTGGRYAHWAGIAFVVVDGEGNRVEPLDLRFTVARISGPSAESESVKIDPTWDGSAVRASATDDIHYTDLVVPLDRCVPWFGANRAETLRHAPVISQRYREDWVGLSDVWLAWMGVGLVGSALRHAIESLDGRRAILGKKMVTHPTVQLNIGEAMTLVASAAAAAETACRQVDERIEAGVAPTEADYLRQMALSSGALAQLTEAMGLIRRTLGGNGLREGSIFDRQFRDFQAMPLHINAHQDRVNLRLGRFALNEEQDPF